MAVLTAIDLFFIDSCKMSKMAHKLLPLLFIYSLLLTACGGGSGSAPQNDTPQNPNPEPPPAQDQGPDDSVSDQNAAKLYQDVTTESGIDFTVGFSGQMRNPEIPVILPSGVAVGDYDGDGDLDLFIVRGDTGPNLLYRNRGGLRFEEVAVEAGLAYTAADQTNYRHSSPAFADIDGDTDLDLLLPGLDGDPTKIYANQGDGTFTDVSEGTGLDLMRAEFSMSPAFGDYDLDGDLDLALGHWGTPRDYINGVGDTEHLWRNDSDESGIRFTSVSVEAGIAPSIVLNNDPRVAQRIFDNSFTPAFAKIDDDPYPDLLFAGDFNTSQVFLNNGDGTLRNATDYDVIIDGNGMGSAVADYDADGDLDWFVSSILAVGAEVPSQISRVGNRLYRNDGGTFSDVTTEAGVASGGWGWGSCFVDFENDGDLDIYHTNGWPLLDEIGGFSTDTSRAFVANDNGIFVEQGRTLGLNDPEQGRGVVCADFDQDGDMDILQLHANANTAATLYENSLDDSNWLSVELQGAAPNTQAVGARILLQTADAEYLREVTLGSNFASHNPTVQLFGLGDSMTIESVRVIWPEGGETLLDSVAVNQHLMVIQEGANNFRIQVNGSSGAGRYESGAEVVLNATAHPDENYNFSHWTLEGEGALQDAFAANTLFTVGSGGAQIEANYLPGPSLQEDVSVARRWVEVLLEAIRNDFARPTVHARNLFHISAAMYDAWSADSNEASPWLLGRKRLSESCSSELPAIAQNQAWREEAISHAAYRLILHRFQNSPGYTTTERNASSLMFALGLDASQEALLPHTDASALGNHLADCYIRFGFADGANEQNDYANQFYEPINPALFPEQLGNPDIVDLDRWQPLSLTIAVDQSGNTVDSQPEFLSPEWGQVYPFALSDADRTDYQRDGFDYQVYHDPGPPPGINDMPELYRWAFSLVSIWSAHLDPGDSVMIDISPASRGNIQNYPNDFADYDEFYDLFESGDPGMGYEQNPSTGLPYEAQMVPRGDYARVLAEFWADGPDSETPPGHWFVLLNEVNDHPLLERRYQGVGAELDNLEWDIKAYFALGGTMHDAAVAAWGIKGWYDYIRPISSIRAMADLGQSTATDQPSYHQDGIPLYDGFIELVSADDPLAGDADEHVGKIKLFAWVGPDAIENSAIDTAGVGWILAENWWPYQRPSFVTPPFAGYVSGHSTYSRAAARVLAALTGDPYFPGGMSQFEIEQNEFLVFEDGPSVDMTLQWATYQDAADQCSLSRIWGGIHSPYDDLPGREIGQQIGLDSFAEADRYFSGVVDQ